MLEARRGEAMVGEPCGYASVVASFCCVFSLGPLTCCPCLAILRGPCVVEDYKYYWFIHSKSPNRLQSCVPYVASVWHRLGHYILKESVTSNSLTYPIAYPTLVKPRCPSHGVSCLRFTWLLRVRSFRVLLFFFSLRYPASLFCRAGCLVVVLWRERCRCRRWRRGTGGGGGGGDVTDQGNSPGSKSKITSTPVSPSHLEEHVAPLQS